MPTRVPTRVPTSQACCGTAFGCSAVRFLQRVPIGCRRVPTAPVGASRIAAHDLLPKTQVPTRVPAGADLAGVLRKRFRLQRRAFLAAGAERVPTGADCASRIAAYDLRKNAGAKFFIFPYWLVSQSEKIITWQHAILVGTQRL